ncbi:MAG: DMT family transporter [Bacteroidales bacterium]|nr:DMT family transporter [Bacteroidales bacterium]
MPVSKSLTSNLLLLLTAIIWGFAFVAQRAGMEHVGPFTFNGIRFLLGCVTLLPLLYFQGKTVNRKGLAEGKWSRDDVAGGLLAGLVMFMAVSLQQIGIVHTTAGKAGFITGLYVILVPVVGIFIRQKTSITVWAGAVVAAIGLYFLSITENFTLAMGDSFVLISGLFFTFHILIIGKFSARANIIRLSVLQFFVCAVLSLVAAFATETIELSGVTDAVIPILYGGIFSVGIAYTLQVAGQKHAHPSAASIILSLESLFAVIGGWLILNELMTARNLFGCALMLSGMIMAQLRFGSKASAIGLPASQEIQSDNLQ